MSRGGQRIASILSVMVIVGVILASFAQDGHDGGMLETISELAPIGTALIAFGAACIALRSIYVQRDIARRRAAIDFFLKTDVDEKSINLNERFKVLAPRISGAPAWIHEPQSGDYKNARAFLNICELIAVGVNQKAFSERVSFDYWGDVLLRTYRDAKPLIDAVRLSSDGTQYTYCELQKLCETWKKEGKGLS